MSVRRHMVASYLSQGYVSVIGIFAVPLQVAAIGVEGFGLVGVLAMLQAWFLLLDFGRVALVTRVSAHVAVHPCGRPQLQQTLQNAEHLVMPVAVAGALLIISTAGIAASRWISVQQMNPEHIAICLCLMGAVVATRLVSELYRGVLVGMAHLTLLAGCSAVMATLRNIAVLPIVAISPLEPVVTFFSFQLLSCLLECSTLIFIVRRKLRDKSNLSVRAVPLVPMAHEQFAWQMSAAALIWVLVSQFDKMLLTGLLPLDQFGIFNMVLVLANGVGLIAAPFGMLAPARLTSLGGAQSPDAIAFYRTASRWTAVLVGAVAAVLALHAREALYLWTGRAVLADQASTLLMCYVLGNAVLAISALPYFLQFSSGQLQFHLFGSLLFAVSHILLMIWGTQRFGMDGAGYAWLITNLLYVAFWIPIAHGRLDERLHWCWLGKDVLPALAGAGLGALLGGLIPAPSTRLALALWMTVALSLALVGAWICAQPVGTRNRRRVYFNNRIRRSSSDEA